jgi:4-hydroxy-3-methylbut-2-enyl diphosphate reductase
VLVQETVARLKALGARSVRPLQGAAENVTFPLPKGLGAGRQERVNPGRP